MVVQSNEFNHYAAQITIKGLKTTDFLNCTNCLLNQYCRYGKEPPDPEYEPIPEITIRRDDLNSMRINLNMPVAQEKIFDDNSTIFFRAILLKASCSSLVHRHHPGALSGNIKYINRHEYDRERGYRKMMDGQHLD